MIQLQFRDGKPIYEQVKEGIKQMVYQNVLSPDEKLPSVREMASKLAINPNTISRAYKELEQEGFLYSQVGVGTFVNRELNLVEYRKRELFEKFDELTKELLYYSATTEELQNRIQGLEKGGQVDDSGK